MRSWIIEKRESRLAFTKMVLKYTDQSGFGEDEIFHRNGFVKIVEIWEHNYFSSRECHHHKGVG